MEITIRRGERVKRVIETRVEIAVEGRRIVGRIGAILAEFRICLLSSHLSKESRLLSLSRIREPCIEVIILDRML